MGGRRGLPIQQIKIDQSLARDLVSDPEDATVVRAVIDLAHGLELEVVAERMRRATPVRPAG